MFCLDTRESDLIKILSGPVKQLPVGDIWIGMKEETPQEGALIIERKSIRDFEASILDGRYKEQRGRILAFCHENKTQPMYILEGSLSSATGRLQKKALMKMLNRLVCHYQIPVMQTATVHETAELVNALVEQWTEDPTSLQRTTELVKVTDGIHVQKKANAMDHKQFAISCLAQCPGISVKMAVALLETFGSLKAIMEAPTEEIEQIKVGTRKIGPVVSKRLNVILNMQ
jgi:ERCC4-type nuclease